MQGLVIEKLEAENFGVQKHFSARIQNGTVVVRGENGAGKSTCMRTLPLYLMFGIDAIENTTLDDLVTEGLPVSSLKASGTLSGIKVKRSKTAASVELPSGAVITGQAEVTQYFRNLLGVRKGTEQMLLVADQDNVAGLARKDLKPSELTAFIEKLAGFSELDEFIDKVKERFPSGNVKIYEASITANSKESEEISTDIGIAEEELKAVREKLSVEKPALEIVKTEIVRTEASLKNLNDKIAEENRKRLNRANLKKAVASKEGELLAVQDQLEMLESKVFEVFSDTVLDSARKTLAEFPRKLSESQDYQKYLQMAEAISSLEADFEGEYSDFCGELAELAKKIAQLESDLANLQGDRAVQVSRLSNDTVCNSCGSDISEKVGRINKEAEEKILGIDAKMGKIRDSLKGLKEEKALYDNIERVWQLQQGKGAYAPMCAAYKAGSIPRKLTAWTGETSPPSQVERDTAADILSGHERTLKAREENSAAVEASRKRATTLKGEVSKLNSSPELLEADIDTTKWSTEAISLTTKITEDKKLQEAKTEIVNNLSQLSSGLTSRIAEKKAAVIRLEGTTQDLQEKIKTDEHNALLLKTAREARPKVIDHIWGTITTAVAAEYNTVTGFDIALEKSQKGFRIVSKEGTSRPMARLSGSEAAVMGNAFRVVLRDIFAPGCGFLIFDEPFASMSKSRTAAAAAALAAVPGQKIIITHDDETELAADQIIEV